MIVVAATQNRNKIIELDAITRNFGFKIRSLSEVGFSDFKVEEDGKTFKENSLKKAMEIHKASGMVTIADDSGLMVESLNGAPGVYSSRFAGEEGNDAKNNKKLLQMLSGLPMKERGAKFVSVITMVFSEKDIIVARGECKGHILIEPRGKSGFGYDPLFLPKGYNLSFAELSADEKNRISHRAKALEVLKLQLEQRRGNV
ncbi:MAG: RdgB/HAM1 family non-canonical purine NTP pyrophosphatase [Anaerovoracaceae bacterium]|jgi:XTP/dITP diphosphohydrolase